MLSTYCVNCNHIANYKNQTVKRGNSAKEYLQQLKHGCKANAKTRGISYFLDDEWYYWQYKQQDGLCYYTGKEMTFITGKGKHINTNISVDRIDSNKPYIAENCVLCCLAMNTKMKNDMSLETLYDFSKSFVAMFERGLTKRAADGWKSPAKLELFSAEDNPPAKVTRQSTRR